MNSVNEDLNITQIAEQKKLILRKYRTLIEAVRHSNPVDKNLIAKTTNLSWQSVNNFLSNNTGYNGLIIENNHTYKINPKYAMFLGIAIGARETKVTLVDCAFNGINEEFAKENKLDLFFKALNELSRLDVVKNESYMICFKTKDELGYISHLCNDIMRTALSYFSQNGDISLLGIGLTFPGIVNKEDLEIEFCPNITCLNGVHVLNFLQKDILADIKRNSISLCISHDTIAITVFEKENLYKELEKNEYKNKGNIVCLYLGMGLGCGVIINNQLLSGKNNSFGEIGHIPAPSLNDFINEVKGMLKNENIKNEKYKADFEKCNNVKKSSCYCREPNCIEKMIRVNVFNSETLDELIENTKINKLEHFHTEHPYRYDILKIYLKYLFNIIINLFNPDLIILSGRTLNSIPALKEDSYVLKQSSGIDLAASACHIINGSDKPECVAIGAGILSYYKLIEDNENNDVDSMKFNAKWMTIFD